MRTGYLNEALLSPADHQRSAETMGADLCRLFGLDPSRYSPAYLRGCAMSAARLLGRHFAFTVDPVETPQEQSEVTLFEESMNHGA